MITIALAFIAIVLIVIARNLQFIGKQLKKIAENDRHDG